LTALFSDLKEQILGQCDMNDAGFVPSVDLGTVVNDALSELYDLVATKYEHYFMNNLTFTIPSGDDGYNMPVGVYKLEGVDKQFTGPSDYMTLPKFNFLERNKWNNTQAYFNGGFYSVAYDWVGGRISIIPATNAPGNYRIWYVPSCPILVNDSDAIPYDLQRWSSYIVIEGTIRCLAKEESNVDYYLMKKNELIGKINAAAINRDSGQSDRVTDIGNVNGWWGGRNRGDW
jgi:hypothetical protein